MEDWCNRPREEIDAYPELAKNISAPSSAWNNSAARKRTGGVNVDIDQEFYGTFL